MKNGDALYARIAELEKENNALRQRIKIYKYILDEDSESSTEDL